jgi:hypothetical protein
VYIFPVALAPLVAINRGQLAAPFRASRLPALIIGHPRRMLLSAERTAGRNATRPAGRSAAVERIEPIRIEIASLT